MFAILFRVLWFLTLVRDKDSSHSPSRREDDAIEGWLVEHSSADLVQVVSWVYKICGLPPAPTEAKMMHAFTRPKT